ncbi:hypothetical protein QE400_000078 [Xanthomonas sacchari]|uniref:hypothetical protein n=1 Tax=Xanthomonas sacchari TaxID=56458 RepID=UPI002787EA17|nr:hypothetical protein [Xanthomonas sacchari]MDQ1090665.1 hypothetical protein [Xanthomonas sacchari]
MGLSDAFSDDEYELVVESILLLRAQKSKALREAGLHPSTQIFTAHDFGIPAIDALLQRLDAEPSATDVDVDHSAPGEVGIRIEGGVVQTVWSDRALNVTVIDYDVDDVPADQLTELPQDEAGTTAECVVSQFASSVMPLECDRINRAVREHGAIPEGFRP